MPNLDEEIRKRGFWEVTIRPATFRERRIDNIMDLSDIVRRAAVSWRGWDFPHVDRREGAEIHEDFIAQPTRFEHLVEVWRLYQSGQFFHLSGISDDWRDRSSFWPAPEGWQPG